MRHTSSWIVAASVVVGCAVLGLSLSRPASGQFVPPVAPGAFVGERFETNVVPGEKAGNPMVYVTDTFTGQVWARPTAQPNVWVDLGIPSQNQGVERVRLPPPQQPGQ